MDNHGLASPPLALTTDRAPPYIPFHLPPPPPSPTPAHKQHVERQYRGQAQQSPVSPSPSFSLACFPSPTTPRLKPAIYSDGASWSGRTAIGSDNSSSSKGRNKREFSEETEPPVEFDANNIRFVPPLNPFMTPSAALIWNDPKLSPIHGSIITTPKSNVSDTPLAAETSFAKAISAALKTPPSSVSPRKRIRVVLPGPNSLGRNDKENVSLTPPKKVTTPARSAKRRRGNNS
ncbi:hypothetical protein GALMADRAFT_581147 [Galerina marginata CBS 339.88]|uniref:Uncharacterized protein n=1 Tax=Galerina marginata (strain CBS 339.88) TaxID=685588 RepID=A0A067T364_GALM3|nr:hypothetical protein GALMADRAFT_581147 [Galerina marginata CBS 339.88]